MADESASGKNVAPNPVEYLAGAVNSCISISAGMIANVHHLDVKNFKVTNQAITTKLGHGKSVVSEMLITVSFESSMSQEEKTRLSRPYSTCFNCLSNSITECENICRIRKLSYQFALSGIRLRAF